MRVVRVERNAAIVALDGGLALLVGAEVMRRKRGPAALLVVVHIVALLGPGYFVPISC